MKYLTFLVFFTSFTHLQAAEVDTQACLIALDVIKKYDSNFWNQGGKKISCKYNERSAAYWHCVINDLEQGGTVLISMGICAGK